MEIENLNEVIKYTIKTLNNYENEILKFLTEHKKMFFENFILKLNELTLCFDRIQNNEFKRQI